MVLRCGVLFLFIIEVSSLGSSYRITKPYEFHASINIPPYHLCSGVVLNSRTILTTAFCADTPMVQKVLVGLLKCHVGKPAVESPEVIKRKMHPLYNGKSHRGDLSLLYLDTPVSKGRIRTPEIWTGQEVNIGQSVRVLGWNLDFRLDTMKVEELYQVDSTVLDPDICQSIYGTQFLPHEMICVDSWASNGTGPLSGCEVDSASPLLISIDDVQVLVGFSLYGGSCINRDYPVTFSRISVYKDWIAKNIFKD